MSSLSPKPGENAGQRSRDSLLRGLKHELRTPLNAILGFADLLLGELDGPLSDEQRENLSMVRQSGVTLLALSNDVLDLATAVVQPVESVYEDADVVALLELLRIELEQRRGMRLVYLRVASSDDVVDARVDQRLLTRALRCLGDVALSQTSSGEIVLGVSVEHEQLQLWVSADGFGSRGAGGAEVAVEELLLDVGRARDRGQRIAGLRLAIARRLLARHSASLHVADDALGRVALHACLPRNTLQAATPLASSATDEAEVMLALTYIAAMSHDLRTPLNAILGFSDLISMDAARGWSPGQERSFAIVRERAIDLASLVDDMIDWAKLEAGELALRPELMTVAVIVERVRQRALQRSGARGLSLDVKLGELGEVMLSVDLERCTQALLGLLDHAIRTSHGAAVRIRVQRTAADIHVVVDDPGLSIRAEDHQGVFDAFRPSYAPGGQRIAGLQLGPAVARSLLRVHGGDVWFESRPAQGTTFTVRLPIPASSLGQT